MLYKYITGFGDAWSSHGCTSRACVTVQVEFTEVEFKLVLELIIFSTSSEGSCTECLIQTDLPSVRASGWLGGVSSNEMLLKAQFISNGMRTLAEEAKPLCQVLQICWCCSVCSRGEAG